MRINVEFNPEYLGRPPWTPNHKSNKISLIFGAIWRRPAYLRMNFK